ncbi:hypothetical protein [Xenophilus sp. Marseille-Q4582]|uniref:hypothetical protein n=1 Tax=Xenophilus sp. Marseille-Q4582 TaxID=2866600 RepID=UPI001CE4589F|nr:hypothetical protein [Xenophilus sp. Marseille-Q4582]
MSDLEISPADELAALKSRADLLGVKYHPSISAEKLREKIAAAQAEQPQAQNQASTAAETGVVAETANQMRKRLKDEALRLVRIRLTCMNPAKREWDGEIFTVANSMIGSVKRFVPFNAEDGWHVEHILYEFLRDRQCPIYVNAKDSRGNTIRKHKMIKEFAIEILPALTSEELQELAARQAATRAID